MIRLLINFPWLYVLVTIAAYIYGPWNFPGFDWQFNLYLFLCVVAIFLGVSFGRKRTPMHPRPSVRSGALPVFRLSLAINFLMAIPTTYARTGHVLPDVFFSLSNPAEAYHRAITPVLPEMDYLRMILAPVLFCAFPLGVANWSRLNKRLKLLFVILTIYTALLFVAMGVNRGIFDIILGGGYLYLLSMVRSGYDRQIPWAKMLLLGTVLLGPALAFFLYGQLNRSGSGASIGYFPAAGIYSLLIPSATSNVFLQYIYTLINQLSIYLSQGYYGALLTFHHGIDCLTFGFGHSDFLLRNLQKIAKYNFLACSPIYEIEGAHGWLHGNYWFSIIPWIASDVGFSGVPIVLFVLSFIYARSVSMYLSNGDGLSLIVAYSLFFLFLYFSANNYIVQSGEGFVATYIFISLWTVRFVYLKYTYLRVRFAQIQRSATVAKEMYGS